MSSVAIIFIAWGIIAMLWVISESRLRKVRAERDKLQHDYNSLKLLLEALRDDGQDH